MCTLLYWCADRLVRPGVSVLLCLLYSDSSRMFVISGYARGAERQKALMPHEHTGTSDFFFSSKERESVEPGLDTGRCEREKDERDQMENKEIGS